MKLTRPAITSVRAGALPRNGTCVILVPESVSTSAAARCAEPPFLAERHGHVLRDDARDHVGGSASGEAHHQPERLRGVILGARRGAGERGDAGEKKSPGHDLSRKKRVAITWQRLIRRGSSAL